MLLLLALLPLSAALTADEIAQFKPRLPHFKERNSGLEAEYSITDNGDGSLTFSGNGIPPHDTWQFPRPHGNPNHIRASNITFKINKEPVMRKTPFTCMPHGIVGMSTSGVIISANYADEKGCPYARDFEELDICDGHPSPFHEYHHHYYSHCIVQPVCGEPSPIIGVAIDGIPIYGPWDENGRQLTQQDLDECGGKYDSQGRYKYIMTVDPPFFMRCFKGELRNDYGHQTDMNFFCSCPYDDSMIRRERKPKPEPPVSLQARPRPDVEMVCDFSGPPSESAKCEDKYNTTYSLPKEWAYMKKTIDLAPCCPKGKDCGFSCKTEEGIKPECHVERRRVTVIENVEKGFCKDKCTKKCEEKTGRKKKCYKKCYNHCQTGFGSNHVR